jgi:hypothetical protein
MISADKNSDFENSSKHITPNNVARQLSYDGHSATEPQKQQNKQIINIRDFRLE